MQKSITNVCLMLFVYFWAVVDVLPVSFEKMDLHIDSPILVDLVAPALCSIFWFLFSFMSVVTVLICKTQMDVFDVISTMKKLYESPEIFLYVTFGIDKKFITGSAYFKPSENFKVLTFLYVIVKTYSNAELNDNIKNLQTLEEGHDEHTKGMLLQLCRNLLPFCGDYIKKKDKFASFEGGASDVKFTDIVEFIEQFHFLNEKKNKKKTTGNPRKQREEFMKSKEFPAINEICGEWCDTYLKHIIPTKQIDLELQESVSGMWRCKNPHISCELLGILLPNGAHCTLLHRNNPVFKTTQDEICGRMVQYIVLEDKHFQWTDGKDTMGYTPVIYTFDDGKTFGLSHVSDVNCPNPGKNHGHQRRNLTLIQDDNKNWCINGDVVDLESLSDSLVVPFVTDAKNNTLSHVPFAFDCDGVIAKEELFANDGGHSVNVDFNDPENQSFLTPLGLHIRSMLDSGILEGVTVITGRKKEGNTSHPKATGNKNLAEIFGCVHKDKIEIHFCPEKTSGDKQIGIWKETCIKELGVELYFEDKIGVYNQIKSAHIIHVTKDGSTCTLVSGNTSQVHKIYLAGPAGSGKSHIISALKDECSRTHTLERAGQNLEFIVLASDNNTVPMLQHVVNGSDCDRVVIIDTCLNISNTRERFYNVCPNDLILRLCGSSKDGSLTSTTLFENLRRLWTRTGHDLSRKGGEFIPSEHHFDVSGMEATEFINTLHKTGGIGAVKAYLKLYGYKIQSCGGNMYVVSYIDGNQLTTNKNGPFPYLRGAQFYINGNVCLATNIRDCVMTELNSGGKGDEYTQKQADNIQIVSSRFAARESIWQHGIKLSEKPDGSFCGITWNSKQHLGDSYNDVLSSFRKNGPNFVVEMEGGFFTISSNNSITVKGAMQQKITKVFGIQFDLFDESTMITENNWEMIWNEDVLPNLAELLGNKTFTELCKKHSFFTINLELVESNSKDAGLTVKVQQSLAYLLSVNTLAGKIIPSEFNGEECGFAPVKCIMLSSKDLYELLDDNKNVIWEKMAAEEFESKWGIPFQLEGYILSLLDEYGNVLNKTGFNLKLKTDEYYECHKPRPQYWERLIALGKLELPCEKYPVLSKIAYVDSKLPKSFNFEPRNVIDFLRPILAEVYDFSVSYEEKRSGISKVDKKLKKKQKKGKATPQGILNNYNSLTRLDSDKWLSDLCTILSLMNQLKDFHPELKKELLKITSLDGKTVPEGEALMFLVMLTKSIFSGDESFREFVELFCRKVEDQKLEKNDEEKILPKFDILFKQLKLHSKDLDKKLQELHMGKEEFKEMVSKQMLDFWKNTLVTSLM